MIWITIEEINCHVRVDALTTVVEKYRAFWADKTSPMSRSDSLEFRNLLGKELQLLFGDRRLARVLEIGCGDGSLFDFLDFTPRFYRGVDFGPRMLATFRQNHPELELVEAEGSSYVDNSTYDLIFSHDVIEHFSREMLERHFRNSRRMMHENSLLICASVPWRRLRSAYDLGTWSNAASRSVARWSKSQISRMLGRDFMGHWYHTEEIARLARKHSFGARFHGSVAYPYRFHAVLWPEAAHLRS
jgi:cyclopropane fatty-acyl-phospholipid synthase-like methyltransferase